jgi:CBS domain-containing protein
MSVGEFCNREVVIARRDESALQAARLLRHHHVGDLIIVDEREGRRVPVGILTDRDLVMEVLAEDLGGEAVTVGDVMQTDVLLANEDQELMDAVKQMRDRGVRRVPVVDHLGELQGILALDDVVELLAEQLTDLVQLIGREQQLEGRRRS